VGKIEKEMLCPICGKKMSLVAAGYYCLKDDYVVDPLTGKPPIEPECVAFLLENRKSLNILFDEDHHLIIRDSSSILHNVSVKDIEGLELGKIKLSSLDKVGIATAGLLFGILGAAAASSGKVYGPTLKITYITQTGMKTSLTLVTDKAPDLARKIASLRGLMRGSVSAPHPSVPVTTTEEKKYCRYCGAKNKTDADFCEKCGKKIA